MTTFEPRPFPFGIGIYSFWDAARYIGATSRDVRRWIRAYSPSPRAGNPIPLWDSQLLEWRRRGVGFRDLVELRFVRAMRAEGVTLPVIRRVLQLGRESLRTPYPITCDRFREIGKQIFLEALATEGITHARFDDVARRRVLRIVAGTHLRRGIELNAQDQATRWFPLPRSQVVVLDPDRRAGDPILTDSGVPTVAIAAAYKADKEDARFVAWQYEITEADVRAAVHFETRWCSA
ncbi:DUF433 domain-containing protein [Luteibacter yeojuensis]|uniref:DUF433 domain-containing protein n=1 Tax=Luteibacter yeojuensis TaxID=345309 RepID=A0A0F3KYX0_9GAMM|nr:DUF433 domain-containing protein [Luteibacter yeojuensis]KJV36418.1 hypothetical protein VI08_04655 [Luteibacter yeojuensis]